MARSRKKTLSQNVVDVATTGMPQPIKKILGGRFVALLIVVCVSALFALGIVSVKWENGRPQISFSQQRAAEVKQEAVHKIQELKDRRTPTVNIPPLLGRESTETVGKRVEELKGDVDKNLEGGWQQFRSGQGR